MPLKLTVVSSGIGNCSFSGKPDSDGLTVSFENETPAFLSWKAFRQLLAYKSGQNGKPDARPVATPIASPAMLAK